MHNNYRLNANFIKTAHIGKWHLGGMTPKDIEARLKFKSNCPKISQYNHTVTPGIVQ